MYNENNCMTLEKISSFMPGALIVYKNNEAEEIVFASKEIARIFECDSVKDFMKFTGGSFATIVYPEDIEEVESIIRKQIASTGGLDYVTYRIITKNGNIKKIEDWGHFVHDEELGDLFYVYLHDMEIREKLTALSGQTSLPEPKAATIDELTGLLNMRAFRLQAPGLIRDFFKKGGFPSCVYFDIRNFHSYNETYGFAGGDRMLKSVARILGETFPNGLIARLGDDHFVLITAQDNLKAKVNHMSVRVNNLRRGVVVEMKAGIYAIKNPSMDISVICDCAKIACDSIKHEYGTNAQEYDGKMDEKLQLQEHIISTLETTKEMVLQWRRFMSTLALSKRSSTSRLSQAVLQSVMSCLPMTSVRRASGPTTSLSLSRRIPQVCLTASSPAFAPKYASPSTVANGPIRRAR